MFGLLRVGSCAGIRVGTRGHEVHVTSEAGRCPESREQCEAATTVPDGSSTIHPRPLHGNDQSSEKIEQWQAPWTVQGQSIKTLLYSIKRIPYFLRSRFYLKVKSMLDLIIADIILFKFTIFGENKM